MKILLIDNHALFREGLRHILQRMPGKIGEILEAETFSDGMRLAGQNPFLDLALLELKLPGSEGAASIKLFRERYPHVPLVVVSSEEDRRVIVEALSHGASGYVCKISTGQVLLDALCTVLSGSIYAPVEILRLSSMAARNRDGCKDKRRSNTNGYGLTPRQMEIVRHLAGGLSNKAIAMTTGLAEGTVKAHISAVYQTLCVKNRLEAARIARQLGLADCVESEVNKDPMRTMRASASAGWMHCCAHAENAAGSYAIDGLPGSI